ncbi:helix-turn-helix transcriptional regulator [Prevotella fusca]
MNINRKEMLASLTDTLEQYQTGGASEMIKKRRQDVLRVTMSLSVIDIVFNIVGKTTFPSFCWLNIGMLVLLGIVYGAYLLDRLSLISSISIIFCIILTDLSVELLVISFDGYEKTTLFLLMDAIIFTGMMCMTIVTYTPLLTIVCFLTGLVTSSVSLYYNSNTEIDNFYLFLVCLEFFITYLSIKVKINTVHILKEYGEVRSSENTVLDFFQMDRSQLLGYIKLAQKCNLSADETDQLLNSFGQHAKVNIAGNISMLIKQKEADLERIQKCLPELTPSELEITRLILQGKKLKDICEILGKKAGNVTSQRTNIRAKLGLNPDDNLFEALQKRME